MNPLGNNNQQGTIGNIAPIKNMMKMLNGAQNPEAAFTMLAQKNPQMAEVIKLVQGRNPQEVFYEMCKQRGINPDDILNQLK